MTKRTAPSSWGAADINKTRSPRVPRVNNDIEYPSDRKDSMFAIRYIRWLMDSGIVNSIGPDALALLVAVVTMEDQLHYSHPPDFWREQLLRRCGMKSPHALNTARKRAVEAGLLHYRPGTKSVPAVYFVTGFDALCARNRDRIATNPDRIPSHPNPIPNTHTQNQYIQRSHFQKPTVEEVKTYCQERQNKVDAQHFVDHYEANGWLQGKGKPIRDWKAAVRTWERNSFQAGAFSANGQKSVNRGPGVKFAGARSDVKF